MRADGIGAARVVMVGAAAGLLALVLSSPATMAYDPTLAWLNPGSQNETSTRPPGPDRAFIREWEVNPPKGYATLAPENVAATRAAVKRYEDIVAQGGWPVVPDQQMQAGLSHAAVSTLRQRLLISGDLKGESNSAYFDAAVEKAVKRFQASNGLTPTGIVDKRTIAALNVPAVARLKQLKANLSRLQEYGASLGKQRYVVVNIPAAQVEAVEGNRVVQRHAGVVGKVDRPTPILRSAIHQMNFNPVWHLPPTVIEKDLIPKGQDMEKKGQSVLMKYGIEAYDGAGRKLDPAKVNFASPATRGLTFRQQPGKENPMGFLKINFHNAHSVYMHDTPSESLFGRNFRAASSGCIRVSGIEQLAAWLLTDNGGSAEQVDTLKKSGERKDVTLKKPVPLYFAYITAWATEDGVVQFRRDLYNRDNLGPMASAY